MELNELNNLKRLCKDDQSFEDLMETVGKLIKERDQKAKNLSLLEAAVSNDYDGILITQTDLENPIIVYANDEFCKMTGYSKEEVIGKTPRILQGPKTDPEVLDRLKKRLSEGKSFSGKTINYRKDGSEFLNQWDIHPLTDGDGDITHWVSYQHDISEQRRGGDGLINSGMNFDELHEESKRTVVEVDLNGNIVTANRAFQDLIGYSKDELKQIMIWELFPQKYIKALKGRFGDHDEASFFGGKEFKGIIKHKNGILIQVQGKTEITEREEGKFIRAQIVSLSFQKRIMRTLTKHLNLHSS